MNDAINQFINLIKSLPPSRMISMVFTLILVIAGFAVMFFWTNQEDYQILFNNLSPEDAGAIVSKVRERNIPYKIEANGTIIMVPAENVYDLRLALAGDGLPNGGNVGFEIFDRPDFRTTKFVQELNYRRALQGELARTINQFNEVKSSRVFIVLPKESLFIEESKPASASIQLDLRSGLPPGKLAAIVHLVANAVEGLESEQVTVVDTKGRVIFKGGNRDDTSALLSNAQLDYKATVENEIRKSVQSMLEGIVGSGKAIVRVNAEIDFNKITLNEEEFDPAAQVVRSKRNLLESTETSQNGGDSAQAQINQKRGVVSSPAGAQQRNKKEDVATNYEINKITRTILKPAGNVKRLSVAAVIDGNYKVEKSEDGTTQKTYIPRSEEELKKFEDIVKKSMGYNEDREDQVTVSSIPFFEAISIDTMTEAAAEGFDISNLVGNWKKTIVNLILVVLVFFLIVRPLLNSVKKMSIETGLDKKELPSPENPEEYVQIPEPAREVKTKQKVIELTKESPETTEQVLRGWISEGE